VISPSVGAGGGGGKDFCHRFSQITQMKYQLFFDFHGLQSASLINFDLEQGSLVVGCIKFYRNHNSIQTEHSVKFQLACSNLIY